MTYQLARETVKKAVVMSHQNNTSSMRSYKAYLEDGTIIKIWRPHSKRGDAGHYIPIPHDDTWELTLTFAEETKETAA